MDRGYALDSGDFRDRARSGLIDTPEQDLKDRIQPGTFEPITGSDLFIVYARHHSLPRPTVGEPVYDLLASLPSGRIRHVESYEEGFVLRRGMTVMVPLMDRITIDPGMQIRASPKSSFGRLFLDTRLLLDGSPNTDIFTNSSGEPVTPELWLSITSLAFDLIIYPHMTFNQIAMLTSDARLTDEELREAHGRSPLMDKDARIGAGLMLTLDLRGDLTEGIVALRAKEHADPIDTRKIAAYDALSFFDPILRSDTGRLIVQPKENYLIVSAERLNVPEDLTGELSVTDPTALKGSLHYAGLIDPNFSGRMVYEVSSDEDKALELVHGMDFGRVTFFHHRRTPDKLYGEGSNYQGQEGIRVSKFFTTLDWKRAALERSERSRQVASVTWREIEAHGSLDEAAFDTLIANSQRKRRRDALGNPLTAILGLAIVFRSKKRYVSIEGHATLSAELSRKQTTARSEAERFLESALPDLSATLAFAGVARSGDRLEAVYVADIAARGAPPIKPASLPEHVRSVL